MNVKNNILILKKLFIFSVFISYFYAAVSSSYAISNELDHSRLLSHENFPVITAVMHRNFPPFYLTTKEGAPTGMAFEVMNEVDHLAGYQTQYLVKDSWDEVYKAMDSGEAQVIPNMGITEERKQKYFFTEPYSSTDINVFTTTKYNIKELSQLDSLTIGVVKHNIGVKLAQQHKFSSIKIYDSIEQALLKLAANEIDALILPKLNIQDISHQLGLSETIKDTGITLKVIYRAIAINKKHPELYQKLNTAVNKYLKTQDYSDTYLSWHRERVDKISALDLILINILIVILAFFLTMYVWKKKKFKIFKDRDRSNYISVIILIGILFSVISIVTFSTLWILYETSFNEQRLRLVDSVKSRARIIEAIARYDLKQSKEYNISTEESHQRTLGQIIDAHSNFQGFGLSGEFTLAGRANDKIRFVLRQRHSDLFVPQDIPFSSERAVPMRLALRGHSGTVIGQDYRGEQVLAAYEPVKILNLGIVAKIDISEIREPFIISALYISMISILFSFGGAILFFYITLPIIQRSQDTEQRFKQLFNKNRLVNLIVKPYNAQILFANEAAAEFYGYNLDELLSYRLDIFIPDYSLDLIKQFNASLRGDGTTLITQHRLQNGEIRDVEVITDPVELNDETVTYLVITDITEKLLAEKNYNQLQKDLEQARKMEALGQLTGGIAHDFNNMLGIVMGYTELTRELVIDGPNKKLPHYLDQVLSASNNAKDLIASMMLFSRTEEEDNQSINIAPLVKENIKMLRSIIPTSIDIRSNIITQLPKVLIEPVKLQQLIMNLCINARDAMDSQGTLTINLELTEGIDATCLITRKNFTGNWVRLTISDTGSGMSEEVIQKIFEPFFTTKAKGKGTGMGMSVVHGIIQTLNGHITIDSQLNKGTSINVFFYPVDGDREEDVLTEKTKIKFNGQNKNILIVDDEESLAEMLSDYLEIYGFKTHVFSSSTEALNRFAQNPQQYDLILSDQTMPHLPGFNMINKMREIRKDIPAIIATGYSATINETMLNENNITLLHKPVKTEELLKQIKTILNL